MMNNSIGNLLIIDFDNAEHLKYMILRESKRGFRGIYLNQKIYQI